MDCAFSKWLTSTLYKDTLTRSIILPAKSRSDVMFCLHKVMGLTFHDRIKTQLIYRIEIAQVLARRIIKPQKIFLGSNLTGCSFFYSFIFFFFWGGGGGGGLILLFSSCLIFFSFYLFFCYFKYHVTVTLRWHFSTQLAYNSRVSYYTVPGQSFPKWLNSI